MAVPNIKLNSGNDMPQVGFGLWKVDGPGAADTVYNAIKAGYRLFDGACGKSPAHLIPFFASRLHFTPPTMPVEACLHLVEGLVLVDGERNQSRLEILGEAEAL